MTRVNFYYFLSIKLIHDYYRKLKVLKRIKKRKKSAISLSRDNTVNIFCISSQSLSMLFICMSVYMCLCVCIITNWDYTDHIVVYPTFYNFLSTSPCLWKCDFKKNGCLIFYCMNTYTMTEPVLSLDIRLFLVFHNYK